MQRVDDVDDAISHDAHREDLYIIEGGQSEDLYW